MTERKTIAVVGATGAHRGGLVRAIAKDPAGEFRARALTRNAGSEAAKALAKLPNVDVVKSDLDDPASVEAAFEGRPGKRCATTTSTAASAFAART